MLLQKTDKARAELQPGIRTLGLRERSLLLMADGRKTLADMAAVLGPTTSAVAAQLQHAGYLEPVRVAAVAPRQAPPVPVESAGQGSDSFEGKRSLATTRMFLFDLCERMFARRNPVLAEQIRETLRQARDREAMLGAARAMLEEIEMIAGFERADSISARIAMLLPPEPAVVSG